METTADLSIEQTKDIMIVKDNKPHAGTFGNNEERNPNFLGNQSGWKPQAQRC